MKMLATLLVLLATMPELAAQPRLLNVRLSLLAFPFTPLLTVEVRLLHQITFQGETNFNGIHGINLKYFLMPDLTGPYLFVGNAWVKHPQLRKDGGYAWLPYAGGGYSMPLGNAGWVADGRIGFGPTIGAYRFGIYPVVKAGVGRWIL